MELGCRVIYLGTGTNFDISTIEGIDYSSLSINNFITEATGSNTKKGSSSHVDNYDAGALAKAKITKNYDSSTGILKASVACQGGYYTNNSDNFSSGVSAILNVKAYLVIGSIEE